MIERIPITMTLSRGLIEAIDRERGLVPRSRAFEQALIRGLTIEIREGCKP